MINNFFNETKPLTDFERALLPTMVKCLQRHVGRKHAVTNRKMREGLADYGYDVSDARIRKIINHIRTHGLVECLMATSKGYYVTTDVAEFEGYLESVQARIDSIQAMGDIMHEQLERLKQKQNLPS